MLQAGNYNILEFLPPTKGMNSNVASEVLPRDFASVLENMLAMPLGSATVRYGTNLLPNASLNADSTILEIFPFTKNNGDKQIVMYVQTFVQDLSANNFEVLSPNSFRFTTHTPYRFAVDTPIKVSYTCNGFTNLYSPIVSQSRVENPVTITVEDNSFPQPLNDELEINYVAFSQGSIYVYDLKTSTLGEALKTGLSVGCVPRSVTFLNTLVICNGVDKVLSWDGTTLVEVVDFVKEDAANNFNQINNTSFSFNLSTQKASVFEIAKYQNNNQIQLKINGVTSTTTVVNIVKAENLITITTADDLPAFAEQPELFYRDWPPAFSYMAVSNNRLWGLGVGAVGLNYRDPNQALVVYFTYQPNTLTNWFDEKLRVVPFIDLSETHGTPDNLEAITFVNGLTIFMGRNKTQVWTGSEPSGAAVDPTRPKFEFSSILPVGIAHGNLILEMPNDVYFVSPTGIQSLSTFNIAKQLAASPNDAVDPLVRQYLTSTANSNQSYRACRSFKYKSGSFCGFKIGHNKVLVSLYATNLYSWSLFSGDFSDATSFLSNLDSGLYLCIKNKVFQYADGIGDSTPSFGDGGGDKMVNFLWSLPVVFFSGKSWANKRYQIQCDYSSSFILEKGNIFSILINGDLRKSFTIEKDYTLPFKGDVLQTIPLGNKNAEDPNQPDPDEIGFRLDEAYSYSADRLKFLSDNFSIALLGSCKEGAFKIKKLKLFGIIERSA